ncbi:MAG: response regulator [Pyrinomonadaceae bacterium]
MSDLRKRILYVDDDPDSCDLMCVWLTAGSDSYDVTVASTANQARKLIAEGGFDLYLLDYCLPEVSGADLCHTIRQGCDNVPIIVYSALSRPIDRESAWEAGADLYLVKPDDLDDLKPAIRRLLENGRAVAFVAAPN